MMHWALEAYVLLWTMEKRGRRVLFGISKEEKKAIHRELKKSEHMVANKFLLSNPVTMVLREE